MQAKCLSWTFLGALPAVTKISRLFASLPPQPNRTSCRRPIHHLVVLHQHNPACLRQPPRSLSCRLHQALPVPASLHSTHYLRRLRRRDRLPFAALRQQFQNRCLQLRTPLALRIAAAPLAAILRYVPVLRPLFTPRKRPPARLAKLLLVRSLLLGLASLVRHRVFYSAPSLY